MRSRLRSIAEWLNPFHTEKGLRKRDAFAAVLGYGAVHLLLVITAITGSFFAGRAVYDTRFWAAHHVTIVQNSPLTSQQIHVLTSMEIQDAQAAACYVPPASLFRLSGVYATVESQYWYDSAALGSTACQDTDELLPYGASQPLHIPGPAWTHVQYVGGGYIGGSGYYVTVQTSNGGRWTFFHVRYPRSYGFGQSLAGGTVIGYTGWPSSLTYSNGSCYDDASCRSDAHLCISTDYLGAAWFYTLTYNPPAKPKPPKPPFNVRAWNAWRVSHHEKPIPYKSHGKLTWAASIWLHHPQLKGIKDAGSWHPGHPGFDRYDFSRGTVYAFPKTGKYKIAWRG